jgi:hypothetical protein
VLPVLRLTSLNYLQKGMPACLTGSERMKNKKNKASWYTIVVRFFVVLFLSILLFLSIIEYTQMEVETMRPVNTRYYRTLPQLLIFVFVCVLAIYFLRYLGIKAGKVGLPTEKTIHIVDLAAFIICAGETFFTYILVDYVPTADQAEIWNTAVCIAKGSFESMKDADWGYFNAYPYQKGLALVTSLFVRIFGANIKLAWFPLGLLSALVIPVLIQKTARLYCKGMARVYLDIFLVIFLPVSLYSVYLYGNLPAFAMELAAFYCTERLLASQKARYAAATVLLCAFGVVIYTSAFIGVIAIVVRTFFYVVHNRKTEIKRKIVRLLGISIIVVLCSVLLPRVLNNVVFTKVTGLEPSKGQPSIGYVCMGISITAENGLTGPGSYNPVYYQIYQDNGRDADATKEVYLYDLRSTILQYIHRERSPLFFVDKTVFQWLDPWFASLGIIAESALNKDPNSFYIKAVSRLARPAEQILIILLTLVYFLALIGTLSRWKKEKELSICEIYFFGGFLFQLAWEQRSRYCLPYFLICFMLATEGMETIIAFRRKSKISKNNRNSTDIE